MSSPNLTSRWSYKKQFLLRFRSDRLLREMMSWHLRSVTFAADLSVNDLTWEAFLTKVYAPSTEQPLVSKNWEFLIESNVLVNQKLKPRPEVFFQFCHLANVVECSIDVLRPRRDWTLPVWNDRPYATTTPFHVYFTSTKIFHPGWRQPR